MGEFLKNKWVRLILVIDVVMVATMIGLFILDASKSSVINLNTAPVDAMISINGETGFTNGMYAVMPGTYEIVVAHEDLEPKAFTVEIASDHVATLVTFLSGKNGDLSFYKLKVNDSSWLKLAEIASKDNNITTDDNTSAEAFISGRKQKTTILEVLPIVVEEIDSATGAPIHYEIRASLNKSDDQKIVINIVDYTSGNRENALNIIRERGFDPDDYTIVYEDESVFKYLPREAENSLGDKFKLDYTYTLEGAPYFLINNYSCSSDKASSEEATINAISDWFSAHANLLSNYQYGILTFCVRP